MTDIVFLFSNPLFGKTTIPTRQYLAPTTTTTTTTTSTTTPTITPTTTTGTTQKTASSSTSTSPESFQRFLHPLLSLSRERDAYLNLAKISQIPFTYRLISGVTQSEFLSILHPEGVVNAGRSDRVKIEPSIVHLSAHGTNTRFKSDPTPSLSHSQDRDLAATTDGMSDDIPTSSSSSWCLSLNQPGPHQWFYDDPLMEEDILTALALGPTPLKPSPQLQLSSVNRNQPHPFITILSLPACYSTPIAQKLSNLLQIPYILAHTGPVNDNLAIFFCTQFYQNLTNSSRNPQLRHVPEIFDLTVEQCNGYSGFVLIESKLLTTETAYGRFLLDSSIFKRLTVVGTDDDDGTSPKNNGSGAFRLPPYDITLPQYLLPAPNEQHYGTLVQIAKMMYLFPNPGKNLSVTASPLSSPSPSPQLSPSSLSLSSSHTIRSQYDPQFKQSHPTHSPPLNDNNSNSNCLTVSSHGKKTAVIHFLRHVLQHIHNPFAAILYFTPTPERLKGLTPSEYLSRALGEIREQITTVNRSPTAYHHDDYSLSLLDGAPLPTRILLLIPDVNLIQEANIKAHLCNFLWHSLTGPSSQNVSVITTHLPTPTLDTPLITTGWVVYKTQPLDLFHTTRCFIEQCLSQLMSRYHDLLFLCRILNVELHLASTPLTTTTNQHSSPQDILLENSSVETPTTSSTTINNITTSTATTNIITTSSTTTNTIATMLDNPIIDRKYNPYPQSIYELARGGIITTNLHEPSPQESGDSRKCDSNSGGDADQDADSHNDHQHDITTDGDDPTKSLISEANEQTQAEEERDQLKDAAVVAATQDEATAFKLASLRSRAQKSLQRYELITSRFARARFRTFRVHWIDSDAILNQIYQHQAIPTQIFPDLDGPDHDILTTQQPKFGPIQPHMSSTTQNSSFRLMTPTEYTPSCLIQLYQTDRPKLIEKIATALELSNTFQAPINNSVAFFHHYFMMYATNPTFSLRTLAYLINFHPADLTPDLIAETMVPVKVQLSSHAHGTGIAGQSLASNNDTQSTTANRLPLIESGSDHQLLQPQLQPLLKETSLSPQPPPPSTTLPSDCKGVGQSDDDVVDSHRNTWTDSNHIKVPELFDFTQLQPRQYSYSHLPFIDCSPVTQSIPPPSPPQVLLTPSFLSRQPSTLLANIDPVKVKIISTLPSILSPTFDHSLPSQQPPNQDNTKNTNNNANSNTSCQDPFPEQLRYPHSTYQFHNVPVLAAYDPPPSTEIKRLFLLKSRDQAAQIPCPFGSGPTGLPAVIHYPRSDEKRALVRSFVKNKLQEEETKENKEKYNGQNMKPTVEMGLHSMHLRVETPSGTQTPQGHQLQTQSISFKNDRPSPVAGGKELLYPSDVILPSNTTQSSPKLDPAPPVVNLESNQFNLPSCKPGIQSHGEKSEGANNDDNSNNNNNNQDQNCHNIGESISIIYTIDDTDAEDADSSDPIPAFTNPHQRDGSSTSTPSRIDGNSDTYHSTTMRNHGIPFEFDPDSGSGDDNLDQPPDLEDYAAWARIFSMMAGFR